MSALAVARRARASSTDEGTRLNAFGEPFRGRKIRGVGVVERARGKAWSSLSGSQRESFGNQQAFGAELESQALNQEAQQAAARGRRDAGLSPSVPAPTAAAPAKKEPEGMLVPGPSGSAVWKTKAELDEQRKTKELVDARRSASRLQRIKDARKKKVAEIDTAKRKAFSRWRVQSEAYIHDPKWARGADPKDVAEHRAALMKRMGRQETRDNFMDVPHRYGDNTDNLPKKTPQTSREWDDVARRPLY